MDDMGQNLYRGEDNTALRFFTKPVKAEYLSEQLGRLVYHTGLYVEVITPGSTESVPEFLVELTMSVDAGLDDNGKQKVKRYEPYYARYLKQIEAYKTNNGEYLQDGMPLSQWPQIDVGTVASLRASGISTVEQLASVSDGNLHNLGTGGRILREKAQQYITTRTFGIPAAQSAGEMADLREQLAGKDEQIRALQAELAAVRANPAPQVPQFGSVGLTGDVGADPAPQPPPPAFDALAGLSEPQPQTVI